MTVIEEIQAELGRATAKFPTWPTDPLHVRGGRVVKASHCDECRHATVKWYEYRGPPAFDVLTCAKKHRPRYYMPRNAMDTDYGWKRVCADFETHNTSFTGTLGFVHPLKDEQERRLNEILGEDCRDHPEWGAEDMTYIDLVLLDGGLIWSGDEKSCDMIEKVNLVLRLMRERWPEFSLDGGFIAQGDDPDDRWALSVEGPGAWATSATVVSAIQGQALDTVIIHGQLYRLVQIGRDEG